MGERQEKNIVKILFVLFSSSQNLLFTLKGKNNESWIKGEDGKQRKKSSFRVYFKTKINIFPNASSSFLSRFWFGKTTTTKFTIFQERKNINFNVSSHFLDIFLLFPPVFNLSLKKYIFFKVFFFLLSFGWIWKIANFV